MHSLTSKFISPGNKNSGKHPSSTPAPLPETSCQTKLRLHALSTLKPQNHACTDRHYCFISAAWDAQDADLHAQMWSIFTQLGIAPANITVILVSRRGNQYLQPDYTPLFDQQRCFGKHLIDVLIAPRPPPQPSGSLKNDAYDDFTSLNAAIEHTQKRHPQCTHIAFTSTRNAYKPTFIQACCLQAMRWRWRWRWRVGGAWRSS